MTSRVKTSLALGAPIYHDVLRCHVAAKGISENGVETLREWATCRESESGDTA